MGEPSLHLTIALATHDWSWSSVVAGALMKAGRSCEEYTAFRSKMEAQATCLHGPWWWRRSVPPALIRESSSASARQNADKLLRVAAEEVGLGTEDVREAFFSKVAHHNT